MLTEDQTTRLRAALVAACGDGGALTLADEAVIAASLGVSRRAVQSAALAEAVVPECYSRNIGTLGLEGQRKLLAARVLVVGLGGLGGHVVETLGRLGVGEIVAADGDVFVESNLNRQLLADTETIGRGKADEAARRIARVNPAVEFTGHARRFEDLGPEAFAGCGVAFDCLDSIPARRALAERCGRAGLPLVHGAIAGWAGQVGVCLPGEGMMDRIYAGPKRGQETRLGNLPFTAAVAANLMVARAVGLLLGRSDGAERQLVFFDLQSGDWVPIDL